MLEAAHRRIIELFNALYGAPRPAHLCSALTVFDSAEARPFPGRAKGLLFGLTSRLNNFQARNRLQARRASRPPTSWPTGERPANRSQRSRMLAWQIRHATQCSVWLPNWPCNRLKLLAAINPGDRLRAADISIDFLLPRSQIFVVSFGSR